MNCTHDEKFKGVFGCPNGCLACKCESLAEVLSALVKALDACKQDIDNAFVLAQLHGVFYPGQGYGREIDAAKLELGDEK